MYLYLYAFIMLLMQSLLIAHDYNRDHDYDRGKRSSMLDKQSLNHGYQSDRKYFLTSFFPWKKEKEQCHGIA